MQGVTEWDEKIAATKKKKEKKKREREKRTRLHQYEIKQNEKNSTFLTNFFTIVEHQYLFICQSLYSLNRHSPSPLFKLVNSAFSIHSSKSFTEKVRCSNESSFSLIDLLANKKNPTDLNECLDCFACRCKLT